MISALAIMALGAVILGAALGFASIKFKVHGNPLVEKIEGLLPQTQCGHAATRLQALRRSHRQGEATSTCVRGRREGVRSGRPAGVK